MTNKRRATIITLSVIAGTILSAGLLYLKRGSLDEHDYFLLATNLFFSILIIFAIGWFLIWRRKS